MRQRINTILQKHI